MKGFQVVYCNPGHWDIHLGDGNRAYRIRGVQGNVTLYRENRSCVDEVSTFNTVSAAMAWIVDKLMYEIALEGDSQ